ncbi:thioesterase domain-containing protein [Streptosporangium sp. NPDC006013]|uniref:thioesterase domain-containing protein n=1 Tax=Streptosporangium sp. NPDC006013 TaxID=3155596 RepID=UPI0033B5DB92
MDTESRTIADAPRRALVPPRYGVERQLRSIWSDILGTADIGVHDNFFELGGTSLQALQAISRIKAEFGYDLPLAVALQAPTIAGLAMLLRGSATQERTPLVEIRTAGSQPPVFCFHALGGSVARYFTLAHALGDDQPLYGLQALGLFHASLAQDSIPEMAATYVREILRVQPTGPYRLVGYSLGGIIAYEAARLLAAHDGRPPVLAMIDSVPDFTYDDQDFPYHALAEFALKIRLPPNALHDADDDQALRFIYQEAVRQNVIGPEFPMERLESIYRTVSGAMTAASRYRPGPYVGRVVLIRSFPDKDRPEDLGWAGLAAAVDTHFVGLGHFVIMEAKGAARIAAVLRPYLSAAHTTTS